MEKQAPSLLRGELRATSIGILILITLIAFEEMAVTTALPTAARELHGLGAYGWVFTGFLVANVVGMVVAGQLSDRQGPRVPMAVGLVAFVVGLSLAGSAPWMELLIAGRVVQGFGGGLLITSSYVVIGERYPESLRPKLFAAISSAWIVPSLVGPVISGALTQHLSWRWVFLGLILLTLLGSALMLPVLRSLGSSSLSPSDGRARGAATSTEFRRRAARPGRIRYALAVAVGIAGLEQVGQHPGLLAGAGAVFAVAALGWGLRTLLPAGTMRARPGVPAPIALRGLLAGAFFGVESVVPLALTVQHGYSATAAGLPLALSGLSWSFGAWWQGRDYRGDQSEHRVRLVRMGMLLLTAAASLAAVAVQPEVSGLVMYVAWCLAGLAAGLVMSTVSVLLLLYTNDADRGSDSAALQLGDATSSAMTTSIAGVLIAAAAHGAISYTAAFSALALAMAAVAFVGVLAAGHLRVPT